MNQCIFCHHLLEENILLDTEYFLVVLDIDPIQVGHLLLISKNHFTSLLEIPNSILSDLIQLEKKIIHLFETKFNALGVSIIQNNGKVMDENTHFHVHLIPRYKNDAFWDKQEVISTPLDLEQLKINLQSL